MKFGDILREGEREIVHIGILFCKEHKKLAILIFRKGLGYYFQTNPFVFGMVGVGRTTKAEYSSMVYNSVQSYLQSTNGLGKEERKRVRAN